MSSGNIYGIFMVRMRDYQQVGSTFFVEKSRYDASTAVNRLIESFRLKGQRLTISQPRMLISTKNGFTMNLYYREHASSYGPLGILYICLAKNGHRDSFVSNFINAVATEVDANPQAISMAADRADADALSKILASAGRRNLARWDSDSADTLGKVRSEMAEVRDMTAANMARMYESHDRVSNIETQSETLMDNADMFKKNANKIEKTTKCLKYKWYFIGAAAGVLVILIIVLACVL